VGIIPFNQMSKEEARAIQSKGGKANKGTLKPWLWRCRSCVVLDICPAGADNLSRAKKGVNPRCTVPKAKRAILKFASDPDALKNSMHAVLVEMRQRGQSVKDAKVFFDAALDLQKYLEPPINKHAVLSANVGDTSILKIIYDVLESKRHWRTAIKEINKRVQKELTP